MVEDRLPRVDHTLDPELPEGGESVEDCEWEEGLDPLRVADERNGSQDGVGGREKRPEIEESRYVSEVERDRGNPGHLPFKNLAQI